MIEGRTRILGAWLVLLVAAPDVIPQTPQSGPLPRQVAARKTGKPANNGSSPATGAIPVLCFRAGVGWQRTLPEPPSPPTTPGTSGSIGLEISPSISGAHAKAIDPRLSGAQQAHAAGCGGNSINKEAVGADVDKVAILNRPRTLRSTGSMKRGTVTTFHGNSWYHAPRSAGTDPVGIAARPAYFPSEAESDAHPGQVGARAFHAYTSSIKLRRLLRNAPDFRTRIKLQQLQNNPQLHRAGTTPKTGAAAPGSRQRGRANQTSSRRPDAHDRSRDNPRKLSSGGI
jgi:hypothetical protein